MARAVRTSGTSLKGESIWRCCEEHQFWRSCEPNALIGLHLSARSPRLRLPSCSSEGCFEGWPAGFMYPWIRNGIASSPPPVWPYQIFESSPFNAPELQITTNGKSLAPGLLFFSPSEKSPATAFEDIAPLIMTDAGELVFNGPIVNATSFRVAKYKGKSILTSWSGLSSAGANIGHGYGNITFLDSSHNEILDRLSAIRPCDSR